MEAFLKTLHLTDLLPSSDTSPLTVLVLGVLLLFGMIIGRTQILNMCNKCGQELRGEEIRNMLPHGLLDEGGRKVAIDIDLLDTERTLWFQLQSKIQTF